MCLELFLKIIFGNYYLRKFVRRNRTYLDGLSAAGTCAAMDDEKLYSRSPMEVKSERNTRQILLDVQN